MILEKLGHRQDRDTAGKHLVAAPAIAPDETEASAKGGKGSSAAVAAVERVCAAESAFFRLTEKRDELEHAAKEQYGFRPLELIGWRNHSAIGLHEIEWLRSRLVDTGFDRRQIDLEFLDAKKRYRAAVASAKDWDNRAGLAEVANAVDQARIELKAAEDEVGSVKPANLADAAAVLALLRTRAETFDGLSHRWEIAALINVSRYLDRATAAGG